MQPVLFTIGSQAISSVGVFLLLSLILATFIIWRVIRVYELDEEKILDLIFLTFISGFVFARIYFVIFHPSEFNNLFKVFLFNKYPGLSFWGGFFGGSLSLIYLSRRAKVNFWQMADLGVTGLFLAITLSSIGCLLGSCQYGLVSHSPIAITQVGLIGKRFPLQIIESLIFLFGFFYLWKAVLRFHFIGQIATSGLILLGLVKFILEPFRGDGQIIFGWLSYGLIWSILLIFTGIYFQYKLTKKSIIKDLKFFSALTYDSNKRKLMVSNLKKSWYNFKVNLRISASRFRKRLTKLLNVKTNPTQFQ